MPSSALVFLCAAALALLALAPAASLAAEAQPIAVIAQANDEEEESEASPPRRRGVVTEEPEAAEDATQETPLPRLGASRRLDPFDHEEGGKRASSPVAPPSAGGNVVVCMAGCDGPSGSVVYKK
jgi:hypothetical protein